jgi:hypothetical protein
MKKILHNKKRKEQLMSLQRKHANGHYIGVIETTMMYYSNESSKEQLISVRIHILFVPVYSCKVWLFIYET